MHVILYGKVDIKKKRKKGGREKESIEKRPR
jgi:hypothetical protein